MHAQTSHVTSLTSHDKWTFLPSPASIRCSYVRTGDVIWCCNWCNVAWPMPCVLTCPHPRGWPAMTASHSSCSPQWSCLTADTGERRAAVIFHHKHSPISDPSGHFTWEWHRNVRGLEDAIPFHSGSRFKDLLGFWDVDSSKSEIVWVFYGLEWDPCEVLTLLSACCSSSDSVTWSQPSPVLLSCKH